MKRNSISAREPRPFQLKYERALSAAGCILGLFHLLITMGNYAIGAQLRTAALRIDRYGALLLLLAALVYGIVTRIKFPGTMVRVWGYLKKAFTGDRLWLTLLFLWYLICCMVMGRQQGRSFFRPNDRYLLDVCISFFLLYMIPRKRKVYEWGIHILTLTETVFMVWAVYHAFRLDVISIPGGEVGMTGDYALSLACNPNTTGAFAAVFFFLAVYMVVMKKGIVRYLYLFSALVQLFPLYLSACRTAYLASVLSFAVICFFGVWKRFFGKSRVLYAALAGIAGGAALYFLRFGIVALFEGVTHLSQYLDGTGKTMGFTSISGRGAIWRAAVKAMFLSPRYFFFGVTPAAVEDMLGYILERENYMMYTHNQFLQMGVAFGVPGLAMYCVWLVKTAINCVRVGLKKEIWVIPAIVLMLVVSNLMESYLVAYFYFCGSIFFLLCGWVLSEAETDPVPSRPGRKKRRMW